MRKNFLSSHQGSAILIALIVLSMITIVTTVFLEKIWGFSQSSNGIEASNRAYYFAEGVIEQQLMDPNVNKYHPWQVTGTGTTAAGTFGTGAYMTVLTGSTIIPATGNGNSPFDSSYNLISLGEPVQLVIPNDITWSNVNLYFRVPQIGSAGTGTDTVYNNSGAILWTIGYTGASLFASGETSIITMAELNNVAIQLTNAKFSGVTNTGDTVTFSNFYNASVGKYLGANGQYCTNYNCTLKLSLIRPVPTTTSGSVDGRQLPFLEYKIVFNSPNPAIPNQYMILQADGYAYGFLRSQTVRVPQITTNTALDFAILQ